MTKLNITLKSDNKQIRIGRNREYKLISVEGLSGANYEIDTTGNMRADGSAIRGKRIASRDVFMVGEYVGMNKDVERDKLVRFFNIHKSGELIADYNGVVRKLNYTVESVEVPTINLYRPLQFMVSLYCKNPFWLDEVETSINILTWIGGLSFPLQLPTQFSMAGPKIVNIFNEGDVEVPIKIEITGTATNPKIINNSTGEYIKVNRTLGISDTLIITTGYGNKRVELNGENVFNYIDLSSKFFDLVPEDNIIELTTDSNDDVANINIIYSNRYIGI